MKHVIYDNNRYLLIPGSDQPERNPETGEPILNPNFAAVTTETLPDPPLSTKISAVTFIKRLTLGERAAVMGSADNIVKAFLFELQAAADGGSDIDLADADTTAGTNYLEQQGLIGVGRAAQILAP